jgi:ribulose-5-phosphate 4-epimerase/fuculose-1-phosphate aldolase
MNQAVVFMANQGAVVVGPDLETAMYRMARLERECEIYWRAKQLGMYPPKFDRARNSAAIAFAGSNLEGQTPEIEVEEVEKETETESS